MTVPESTSQSPSEPPSAQPSRLKVGPQKVYVALSGLFILGVFVAFFLAGEGIFGLDQKKLDDAGVLDPHRATGNALGLIALIMLIVAAIARSGRRQVIGSAVLLVLAGGVQSALASASNHFVAGLHVLDAGIILTLAFWLHLSARKLLRAA